MPSWSPSTANCSAASLAGATAKVTASRVVTIRCARLHQNTVRLFAGAGIVPASSRWASGARRA
ncbi:hypothetical protein ACVXG7_08660 [Enterobacter hormaechei]